MGCSVLRQYGRDWEESLWTDTGTLHRKQILGNKRNCCGIFSTKFLLKPKQKRIFQIDLRFSYNRKLNHETHCIVLPLLPLSSVTSWLASLQALPTYDAALVKYKYNSVAKLQDEDEESMVYWSTHVGIILVDKNKQPQIAQTG